MSRATVADTTNRGIAHPSFTLPALHSPRAGGGPTVIATKPGAQCPSAARRPACQQLAGEGVVILVEVVGGKAGARLPWVCCWRDGCRAETDRSGIGANGAGRALGATERAGRGVGRVPAGCRRPRLGGCRRRQAGSRSGAQRAGASTGSWTGLSEQWRGVANPLPLTRGFAGSDQGAQNRGLNQSPKGDTVLVHEGSNRDSLVDLLYPG